MPRQGEAPEDSRIWEIRDNNKHYEMPRYKTREEWLRRAEYLRRHILICCGLWPLPEENLLKPRIFGRVEREGYAIEKVYFESYPGFFVTGNLYTPLEGEPPFPGVLCPHGHWRYGRLEDSEISSVVGRCINLAMQGYVVFSYDMVGYNDSFQVDHNFAQDRGSALWGVSLAGLQLWNSIRSIDFLQSLDIVDPDRIGCTGASGGGTQTFLLTAVDSRVSVSAPVCMVSAHFQGGCLCENPPNLRVETFNVEIAALAAPRPLLLVSATGDWTRDTPVCEYPAIREIYKLFDAEDRVRYVHIDAGHNYNRARREAVYKWFGRWLLGEEDERLFHERPFKMENPRNLLVFYGTPLPETGMSSKTLREYLISKSKEILNDLEPRDMETLERYRDIIGEIYRHSLLSSQPGLSEVESSVIEEMDTEKVKMRRIFIGRKGAGDRVPAFEVEPKDKQLKGGTLIIDEKGKEAILKGENKPNPLVKKLLELGHRVLSIDCFGTGEYLKVEDILKREESVKFYTTYNKTILAERVQDILTAATYLNGTSKFGGISLIGRGEAGLWCLLARGLARGIKTTIVDLAKFNQKEDEWLSRLYTPLILRAGGLKTSIALTAPSRLFIHNYGEGFNVDFAVKIYKILGADENLRVKAERAGEDEILEWINT